MAGGRERETSNPARSERELWQRERCTRFTSDLRSTASGREDTVLWSADTTCRLRNHVLISEVS